MFYDEDSVLDDEPDVKHLSLRQMLRRIVPLFRPHRGTLVRRDATALGHVYVAGRAFHERSSTLLRASPRYSDSGNSVRMRW